MQFVVVKNWQECDEKYARAKNHFDKLELNNLYISHAAEEFSECQYSLKRIYETGGKDLVQAELLDRIQEHRSNMKNTWRAALYDGLLNSNDFLDVYFERSLN